MCFQVKVGLKPCPDGTYEVCAVEDALIIVHLPPYTPTMEQLSSIEMVEQPPPE